MIARGQIGMVKQPERGFTELANLRDELARVKEENRHLREAARTFGQLAERLNRALQEELRRRATPEKSRTSSDGPRVERN
jgi:hypothetical protein